MNELTYVISDIKQELERMLQNAGIYYRIFARQKTTSSVQKKLLIKGDDYKAKNKKMQDIIGVRIVFYFMDDVDIFNDYLHRHPRFIDDSSSQKDLEKAQKINNQIENLAEKMFMPVRLNLVFKMDEHHKEELYKELESQNEIDAFLIDATYEIQLRTVLSEGWHEVEHDLRYKSKNEAWWKKCEDESRMLNGIYATLETSERALLQIFSSISYKNYKSGDWSAMMRNHLRLHTQDTTLSANLLALLDNDKNLAKSIFRVPRKKLIEQLLLFPTPYPLKLDNILFLMNRMSVNNELIIREENQIIKGLLDKFIKKNHDYKINNKKSD